MKMFFYGSVQCQLDGFFFGMNQNGVFFPGIGGSSGLIQL